MESLYELHVRKITEENWNREEERRMYKKKFELEKINKAKLMESMRYGKAEDYLKWLKGFLTNGGKIDGHDNNLIADGRFLVAIANFTMIPFYGSSSVKIIVPKGIQISNQEDNGHNRLFFMEDYTSNSGTTHTYSDVRRLIEVEKWGMDLNTYKQKEYIK